MGLFFEMELILFLIFDIMAIIELSWKEGIAKRRIKYKRLEINGARNE